MYDKINPPLNHIKFYKVITKSHLIYVSLVSHSDNLSQFCPKTNCFRANGNFETSAWNDQKVKGT